MMPLYTLISLTHTSHLCTSDSVRLWLAYIPLTHFLGGEKKFESVSESKFLYGDSRARGAVRRGGCVVNGWGCGSVSG